MADKKLMELIDKNKDLIGKHKELSKKHNDLARKHEDLHTELARYAEDMGDTEDEEEKCEETPKEETPKEEEKNEIKVSELETEKLEYTWEQWMEKDPAGLMKLAAENSPVYLKLQSEVETNFLKVGLRGLEALEEMKKNKE